MRRSKRDKPVERIRTAWTSSADLEETLAAMFNVHGYPGVSLTPGMPANAEVKLTPHTDNGADAITKAAGELVPIPEANLTTGQVVWPGDILSDDGTEEMSYVPRDKLAPAQEVNLTPDRTDALTAVAGDKLTPGSRRSAEDKLTIGQPGMTEANLTPAQTTPPRDNLTPPLLKQPPRLESPLLPDGPASPGDNLTTGQLSVPDAKLASGQNQLPLSGPLYQTLDGTVVNPDCIRPYDNVQQAHTASEHLVYTTMWKLLGTRDDEGTSREGKLSLSQLTSRVSISRRNLRRVLHSLIEKLAIDVTEFEDRANAIPRSYRVWGFRATIERRRREGYNYIYRNRNYITLARLYRAPGDNLTPAYPSASSHNFTPETGDSLPSRPEDNLTSESLDNLTPEARDNLTVAPEAKLASSLRKKESNPLATTSSLILEALHQTLGYADDDAVQRILTGCRQKAPDARELEIVDFIRVHAPRIRRNRGIDNPMGALIRYIPQCFEGKSFRKYRESQFELWQQVLEDPDSTEEDRQMARDYLHLTP